MVSKRKQRARHGGVLRRLLWTGLSAGLTTLAAVAARRAASKIWLESTGTTPPVES